MVQEYLPPELLEQSSLAADPDKHILKTPDAELRGKEWDEKRLSEWEKEVNGGSAWGGPFEPEL
jgi:putative ATPase